MRLSIKTLLMIGLVLGTFFLISIIVFSSYYSSKQSMLKHANQIMLNISDFALDKSKQFMYKAKDAANLSQRLASNKVVNSKDFNLMIHYFYEQLQINKEFSALYYGNKNSNFTMLLKNKKGYFAKRVFTNELGEKVALKIQYDNTMKNILEKTTSKGLYDPRSRIWFKKAVEKKSLIWTNPYIFFTSQKLGITTASPIYNSNNEFEGVIGVDIEISELTKFITSLKISKNSKVFMMDDTLKMMAFPNKNVVIKKENKSELKDIHQLGDEIALKAYNIIKAKNGFNINKREYLTFTTDDGTTYHSLFIPFNMNNIKWIIGMYLPEDDYLGTIKRNQQLNILITIIFGFLFIIIGYFVARSINNSIQKLQYMAKELNNLNLNIPDLKPTIFTEFNETINASNKMKNSLKKAYTDTLLRLAIASEFKDTDTAEHIKRIGYYCVAIGKKLNLSDDDLYILKHASGMHDIGKLAIPDNILMKPAKLSPEERVVMETHSKIGANILDNPSSNLMENGRVIALYHHEKWDGTGYPQKLKENEIPLFARIVAIADVFDALVSKRCYKNSMPASKAKEIIIKQSGTHFDPKCVKAFIDSFDEIVEIHEKYKD
ncbi:MAG: HD domain-containing phosphohydrolase [Halarcobacter sp.]